MKTWHIRRGRNMFRNDFGWYMLENVEGLSLSVLLRAWAWACIRSSVLVYVGLFLRLCVCGDGPICGVLFTYVGFDLSTWHTWQRLYSAHFHFFSTISLLYAILKPLFVIFASEHHCILLFIIFLSLKTSFLIIFAWIKNLMLSSSFVVFIPLCW